MLLSCFFLSLRSQIASPAEHPRRRAPSPPPEPPTPTVTDAPAPTTAPETQKKGRASQSTSPKSGSVGGSRATTPTHTGVYAPPSGLRPTSSSGTTSPPQRAGAAPSSGVQPVAAAMSAIDAKTSTSTSTSTGTSAGENDVKAAAAPTSGRPKKELFYPSSSTSLSAYYTLVYHVVTPRLALLAMLPTTVWEGKRGLVEYNIVYFR